MFAVGSRIHPRNSAIGFVACRTATFRKRMRWRTYNRYVERFDKYEDILADEIVEVVAKLLTK